MTIAPILSRMHPILFELWGSQVQAYGVLVALGYLAGTWFLWIHRDDMGMSHWQFWILCYCIVAGAVVGAKVGFYLVEWELFIDDPWWLLRNWRFGYVFWSGFIGTLVAAWVYQQGHNAFFTPKKRYLGPADYFGAALPLGHAIGRVGCFLQACCHGKPTSLPWGAAYTDPRGGLNAALLGLPLHPVQLYEAAGDLVISAAVAFWVLPRIRAARWKYGTAFFGYIAAYSVMRFFTEFARGDDRGFFLSARLSPSQWWSLGGFAVAAFCLWRNGVRETDPKGRSLFF